MTDAIRSAGHVGHLPVASKLHTNGTQQNPHKSLGTNAGHFGKREQRQAPGAWEVGWDPSFRPSPPTFRKRGHPASFPCGWPFSRIWAGGTVRATSLLCPGPAQ